jgi:hypothetical protein
LAPPVEDVVDAGAYAVASVVSVDAGHEELVVFGVAVAD